MNDFQFTPVQIVGATAQSMPGRHGYTRVIYRLSAPVPGAWIERFDNCCRECGQRWSYDRPIALVDRIEVLLPDHDHADRAALTAIKTYLETAIAAANRLYAELPPGMTIPEAPAISWERKVLLTLQAALDEQFPA